MSGKLPIPSSARKYKICCFENGFEYSVESDFSKNQIWSTEACRFLYRDILGRMKRRTPNLPVKNLSASFKSVTTKAVSYVLRQ